tara:strand:- start:770 stop:1051 length:282 start_codon:yes stop_codon:yes gene_type:complete
MSKYLINKWQEQFGITDWQITTEKIDPKQVVYNGETYFVGIERNFENKEGIIYHDIDLCEESIVHELLHVRNPDKNEEWINMKTTQILKLTNE